MVCQGDAAAHKIRQTIGEALENTASLLFQPRPDCIVTPAIEKFSGCSRLPGVLQHQGGGTELLEGGTDQQQQFFGTAVALADQI